MEKAEQTRPDQQSRSSASAESGTSMVADFADNRSAGMAQRRVVEAVNASPYIIAQREQLKALSNEPSRQEQSPAQAGAGPSAGAAAQLTPATVVSTGITHIVEERDSSIFGGNEVEPPFGEISPGERLIIDDGDIVVSRRGIHAFDDPVKRGQYEIGPQKYDWYRVLSIKGRDVRGEHFYVRDGMFAAVPAHDAGLPSASDGALESATEPADEVDPNVIVHYDGDGERVAYYTIVRNVLSVYPKVISQDNIRAMRSQAEKRAANTLNRSNIMLGTKLNRIFGCAVIKEDAPAHVGLHSYAGEPADFPQHVHFVCVNKTALEYLADARSAVPDL